jgi:oligoendopeptidase F
MREATMTGSREPAGGLPSRSALDPAYTWDLESIFPSDNAWEARFAELSGRLDELEQHRESFGTSSANVLAALQARDILLMQIEHVRQYAALRDPAVFQSAFDVLTSYVDRLEQLV